MTRRAIEWGEVDLRVIFRNGTSIEYTHYGTIEDLLVDTQHLLEARNDNWDPGELYHFGHWSFDLSKVMAIFVGNITSSKDVPGVMNC